MSTKYIDPECFNFLYKYYHGRTPTRCWWELKGDRTYTVYIKNMRVTNIIKLIRKFGFVFPNHPEYRYKKYE